MPVTIVAHRYIQAGNAARDHQNWTAAIEAYRAALMEAPGLAHIWVQFGHALKEAGKIGEAVHAYRKAIELRPAESDARLHLGHVLKVSGDTVNAARSYIKAVEADPNNLDALTELHRIVVGSASMANDIMIDMLRTLVLPQEVDGKSTVTLMHTAQQAINAALKQSEIQSNVSVRVALEQAVTALDNLAFGAPPHGKVEGTVFFDISDLIHFFAHSRLPTGIQRVQIEVIVNRIAASGQAIQICCYNDDREGWLSIPAQHFDNLAHLSLVSGNRKAVEWIQALTKLHLALALSELIEFPSSSFLVTLGASWGHPNFFLALRRHKCSSGLRYVPFIHDFVPIVLPQHHLPQLTSDFLAWVIAVLPQADGFLVNSEATKRDLLQVATTLQLEVAPLSVAVIRLDADFRKLGMTRSRNSSGDPSVSNVIKSGPFVLMVATLEPRKGHLTAFQAWLTLIRRHGRRHVPRLVCVGGKGWMNEAIHDLLANNTMLASCVTILSNVSDDGLATLYQACQFTIYPSLYEGWGLPITEALCYGKPVIASDVSSMPEAGGAFATYFASGSHEALTDAVERMSFDVNYRDTCAAHIASAFRPRTWQEIAAQIETEVARLGGNGRRTITPEPLQLGKYYKISRTDRERVWRGLRSGESIRMGNGWLWPEEWGCWTRVGGGELHLTLPPAHGSLQLALLIRNIPNCATAWTLWTSGDVNLVGALRPCERRWVRLEIEASLESSVLRIRLTGDQAEMLSIKSGNAQRDDMAAVGLEGFHIHAIADVPAGVAFLEAATFGTLDQLDVYAEPSPSQSGPQLGSVSPFQTSHGPKT